MPQDPSNPSEIRTEDTSLMDLRALRTVNKDLKNPNIVYGFLLRFISESYLLADPRSSFSRKSPR